MADTWRLMAGQRVLTGLSAQLTGLSAQLQHNEEQSVSRYRARARGPSHVSGPGNSTASLANYNMLEVLFAQMDMWSISQVHLLVGKEASLELAVGRYLKEKLYGMALHLLRESGSRALYCNAIRKTISSGVAYLYQEELLVAFDRMHEAGHSRSPELFREMISGLEWDDPKVSYRLFTDMVEECKQEMTRSETEAFVREKMLKFEIVDHACKFLVWCKDEKHILLMESLKALLKRITEGNSSVKHDDGREVERSDRRGTEEERSSNGGDTEDGEDNQDNQGTVDGFNESGTDDEDDGDSHESSDESGDDDEDTQGSGDDDEETQGSEEDYEEACGKCDSCEEEMEIERGKKSMENFPSDYMFGVVMSNLLDEVTSPGAKDDRELKALWLKAFIKYRTIKENKDSDLSYDELRRKCCKELTWAGDLDEFIDESWYETALAILADDGDDQVNRNSIIFALLRHASNPDELLCKIHSELYNGHKLGAYEHLILSSAWGYKVFKKRVMEPDAPASREFYEALLLKSPKRAILRYIVAHQIPVKAAVFQQVLPGIVARITRGSDDGLPVGIVIQLLKLIKSMEVDLPEELEERVIKRCSRSPLESFEIWKETRSEVPVSKLVSLMRSGEDAVELLKYIRDDGHDFDGDRLLEVILNRFTGFDVADHIKAFGSNDELLKNQDL